jgi:hypothetical protein
MKANIVNCPEYPFVKEEEAAEVFHFEEHR